MNKEDVKVGLRVRLAKEWECFPMGFWPVGETGRVVEILDEPDPMIVVKLDAHYECLDGWENDLQIYSFNEEPEDAPHTFLEPMGEFRG